MDLLLSRRHGMKNHTIRLLICLTCIMVFVAAGAAIAAEHTYQLKVDGCWT
jgi:hypothetical protein